MLSGRESTQQMIDPSQDLQDIHLGIHLELSTPLRLLGTHLAPVEDKKASAWAPPVAIRITAALIPASIWLCNEGW